MVSIGECVRPCDLRLHLMKEISGMPTSLKGATSKAGAYPDVVGEPSSSSASRVDRAGNSQVPSGVELYYCILSFED
ncbi:hypothetical protein IFM89_029945 [Coptis chinensis]|uniref:Uncharacterized protein n=1 Tax=Coptis chinensis TaxID=261450 RepID=A0A835HGD5_9MAGN|nr:hypothetical protein IFM89_029945 [Coptis chinensis]